MPVREAAISCSDLPRSRTIESTNRTTAAETVKLEREAKIGAAVEIELTAASIAIPGDRAMYLEVSVAIENRGMRNTAFAWEKDPLLVYSSGRKRRRSAA